MRFAARSAKLRSTEFGAPCRGLGIALLSITRNPDTFFNLEKGFSCGVFKGFVTGKRCLGFFPWLPFRLGGSR